MSDIKPLFFGRSSDEPERQYRIALTTPVWSSVSSRFLHQWATLIGDANSPKGRWAEWATYICTGSLLPLVRNEIVVGVANMGMQFTHLIMVDSDVLGLTIDGVKRLVDHDVPIVAPLICLRETNMRPACDADDEYKAVYEELDSGSPGLVQRRWVGTGCICIKWAVIEDMVIDVQDYTGVKTGQWFRSANLERDGWERDFQECVESCVRRLPDALGADEGETAGKVGELFAEAWMHGREVWNGGRQAGEDIEFCLRARTKGYPSFLDCGLQLVHQGTRDVGIQDHLDFIRRERDAGG